MVHSFPDRFRGENSGHPDEVPTSPISSFHPPSSGDPIYQDGGWRLSRRLVGDSNIVFNEKVSLEGWAYVLESEGHAEGAC